MGIAPDDFVVGKIARLFKLKGHDDLFAVAPELVRQNPKIKFLLVGDGEWRGRFENLAKTLGLEKHFIFTGLVPPAEVPRYVGIMDALVHLSLREGLPRALPQALAAGKPVVAYDCDGAREICLDGQTGFLIQPGDLTGLKNRLLQLAGDSALRERLGRSGQDFVRENFAVEKMVDAIYNLYLKLLNGGCAAARRTAARQSAPLIVSFPFNYFLAAFAGAFLTTLLALPLWRKWCLRIKLVDDPGQRKIHDQPVPLAGGLAVLTGILLPLAAGAILLKTGAHVLNQRSRSPTAWNGADLNWPPSPSARLPSRCSAGSTTNTN